MNATLISAAGARQVAVALTVFAARGLTGQDAATSALRITGGTWQIDERNGASWAKGQARARPARAVRRQRPTLAFASLTAGDISTCGVTSRGEGYCWGVGPLGHEEFGSTPYPQLISGSLTWAFLSPSYTHSCGVTTAGAAYCWGKNPVGELGNGRTSSVEELAPQRVVGPVAFRSISAGMSHTCGVANDGAAYCWGGDALGGGDNVFPYYEPGPVAGALRFQSVSAAAGYSCGLTTAGAAYCWGASNLGQLGDGLDALDWSHANAPQAVVGGLTFVAVSARANHVCGIATGGAAYCWGANRSSQLGDGSTKEASSVPVAVAGGLRFTSISVGAAHTCAVTTAGEAYCWGANDLGQLGNGIEGGGVGRPTRVVGGHRFASVTAGTYHTCGLTPEGVGFCWGLQMAHGVGRLGVNPTAPARVEPAPVTEETERRTKYHRGQIAFTQGGQQVTWTFGSGYFMERLALSDSEVILKYYPADDARSDGPQLDLHVSKQQESYAVDVLELSQGPSGDASLHRLTGQCSFRFTRMDALGFAGSGKCKPSAFSSPAAAITQLTVSAEP